jgi:hypothetical protein
MGGAIGGIVNAVKGVVDAVAPIASMIPGVGMFAMAAKAAVDIGGGIMHAMSAKGDQDQEDASNNAASNQTAQAFQKDAGGGGGIGDILGGVANMAQQVLGGGIGGLLGGL